MGLLCTLSTLQVIDEKESVGLLQPTKIEIKLKKAEPIHWVDFEISSLSPDTDLDNNEINDSEEAVDAVDLSDL